MFEYIKKFTDIRIEDYEEKLEESWNTFLKPYGIKFPKKGSNKYYQLIYLYANMGKAVHKNFITQFVQSRNPSASGDQQVRHLATQNGYYILLKDDIYEGEKLQSGYYMMVSIKEPNPGWLNKNQVKRKSENANENELKELFNNCCATCGAKEGEPHKITGHPVQLQKGHMDPSKPLAPGNIIMQCQYCNQTYRDDFIFDEFGYIREINSVDCILRRTKPEVIKELYKMLDFYKKK